MKIKVIKFLRKIFQALDEFVVFLNSLLPKREVVLKNKKILVNRSARLGDALYFLPEFFAAQEKLDVTVMTSEYNDEAFRHFFKTIPSKRKPRQDMLDGLVKKVFEDSFHIMQTCWWFINSHLSDKEREYDVFICTTDDLTTLDYALPRSRYVVGTKKYYSLFFDRLIDTDIFSAVGLKIERDYTYFKRTVDRIDSFVESIQIPKIKHPYLLINIGCKKGRNISDDSWIQILDKLERFGKKEGMEIAVMDNRDRETLSRLEAKLVGKQIHVINEPLTLWQGYKLAKGSLLYVGMDIGPSHLLQMPTNSIMIYTVGNYRNWRQFAFGWHKEVSENGNVMEVGEIGQLSKAILYHESSCRPCIDEECETGQCMAISSDFIATQIEKLALESKGISTSKDAEGARS